jgi:predicted NBD/HSP70 family sugar kinase
MPMPPVPPEFPSDPARTRPVRTANVQAVVERLALEGPASRTDLARSTGLSATSVGRLVDDLLRSGLVAEGGRVTSGVGRPQTLVHLRGDAASVAGVSIRSRSVRVRLADLDGTVLAAARVDRVDDSPEALGRQVAAVVADLRDRIAATGPLTAVAIGVSGVWDGARRRVFAAPNLAVLEEVDAHALFEDALADVVASRAITLDNDVNLAAIGEQVHGAARGCDGFFYLSLGSGVGGAMVVDGTVHRGASGFAGEVGALPVVWEGRIVRLEDLLGRRALEAHTRQLGLAPTRDEVLAWLERDGAKTRALAEHVAGILGQALAAVVATLDPRLIVLGGSVGGFARSFTDRVRDRLAAFVPVVPEVVSTQVGHQAPLLGAVVQARATARTVLVQRAVAATGLTGSAS